MGSDDEQELGEKREHRAFRYLQPGPRATPDQVFGRRRRWKPRTGVGKLSIDRKILDLIRHANVANPP